MLNYFRTCFTEDLLYAIFGKYLVSSPIFLNAEKTFFKSLLLEMNYTVYLRRAIIYRFNDIQCKIFFLVCGEIDVLGPDYNKLLTLSPGSLFGNLDYYPYKRQTLMMVAKSNVEMLEIFSIRFHYVTLKYLKFYKRFRRLTALNVDYIESYMTINKPIISTVYLDSQKGHRLYNLYVRLNPLHTENVYLRVFSVLVLVCVDFLGFHVELYQKITLDNANLLLAWMYLLDFIYLVKIYINFNTCYKDEFGMIIRNRRNIALKYVRDKVQFYIDILSTIPFEIICIFFTNYNTRLIVFSFCRINRCFRVVLAGIALKNTQYINTLINKMLLTAI